MESNAGLVKSLKQRGYLSDPRVEDAFLKVDRARFVPKEFCQSAYEDRPLPILEGMTISAPSVVAMMSQALAVNEGCRILEVGTGSGYQAAILSVLAGRTGKVSTVEIAQKLCKYSKERLEEYPNVTVHNADGSLGLPADAPFDRIIVSAACPSMPKPLEEQLREGGIIVAPVEGLFWQDLVVARKTCGKIDAWNICPVIFVPLAGKHGFTEKRAGRL